MDAPDLSYSLRRGFVDEFHTRHVPGLAPGSRVLDLGGNRVRKRGSFDIERYDLRVVYANLSVEKSPHVQANAARLPFRAGCFDVVICSELLEHVPDPRAVIEEAARVLRADGVLLICVPFLHQIHGDPHDYGRYTDHYWRELLGRQGFEPVEIERQGLFWSVVVDFLRARVQRLEAEGRLRSRWSAGAARRFVGWGRRRALELDERARERGDSFMSSFTTGFGIRAVRRGSAAFAGTAGS